MRNGIFLVALVLAAATGPAWAESVPADALVISPQPPTTADSVVLTVQAVLTSCPPNYETPKVEGQRIVLRASLYHICDPAVPRLYVDRFTIPPLSAGTYIAEVVFDGQLYTSRSFNVAPPGPLGLQDTMGVAVHWKISGGPEGVGVPVQLTRESGYFWFFDHDNIEVTAKILDGRLVNGHFWVFLSSLTSLETEITVTRCPNGPSSGAPCLTKTYVQPEGHNLSIIDLSTF